MNSEQFESLLSCHPTAKKKFVELLLRELIKKQYTIDESTFENYRNLISNIISIYIDIQSQDYNSLNTIENTFKEYSKYSIEFKTFLQIVFENAFKNFNESHISWDYELDIEPIQRYLIIDEKIPIDFLSNITELNRHNYDKLSDIDFNRLQQEFNSFLLEKSKKNFLSIYTSYSYANVILPKTYDVIFDIVNPKRYWIQKVILKYAFNFKTIFHTDLWRGHHSHCFIEVIGDIPNIFDELPINGSGEKLHKGIGLCTKYDWQYIKSTL